QQERKRLRRVHREHRVRREEGEEKPKSTVRSECATGSGTQDPGTDSVPGAPGALTTAGTHIFSAIRCSSSSVLQVWSINNSLPRFRMRPGVAYIFPALSLFHRPTYHQVQLQA